MIRLPAYYLCFLAIVILGCNSSNHQSTLKSGSNAGLIPYAIEKSSEFGTAKASFDVRVDLVNNRLPTQAELVAISQHLKSESGPHDRIFVVFYLPGMIVDSGGFATAHHAPHCEFRLLPYNLPAKYADLAPQEQTTNQEHKVLQVSTEPINVVFDFEIEWNGDRPEIVGTTNLPNGTQIMTSVLRQNPPFMAQDKIVVKNGRFRAGPFGPASGLPRGEYVAGATMPFARTQPESVQRLVGERGENLRGDNLKHNEMFGTAISVDKPFSR